MVPEKKIFGKSLFFGLESRTMAQNEPIDNSERMKSYVDRWDPSVTPGFSQMEGSPMGSPHGPRIYQFLKNHHFFDPMISELEHVFVVL